MTAQMSVAEAEYVGVVLDQLTTAGALAKTLVTAMIELKRAMDQLQSKAQQPDPEGQIVKLQDALRGCQALCESAQRERDEAYAQRDHAEAIVVRMSAERRRRAGTPTRKARRARK